MYTYPQIEGGRTSSRQHGAGRQDGMRYNGQDKAGKRRVRGDRRDRKRSAQAKAETLELRTMRTLKRATRKVATSRENGARTTLAA